ncbi:hypothetical protein WME89_25365 [Sorangium sp. So ce321]|uniref:hypothetical protein n=1 Tax=Sorangium sp. So ce321 TaxID=3133300 RepID=UPI003F62B240
MTITGSPSHIPNWRYPCSRRFPLRLYPPDSGFCLIATLLLAPHGEQLLFELTPKTVALSLVGHLVFGAVVGALMRWTGSNVRPYAADRQPLAPP